MNNAATSREQILKEARRIVRKEGIGSVNIRSLASSCSVSLGTVYNYFSSKSELTQAVVESIWRDIFHDEEICTPSGDIVTLIEKIYSSLEKGAEKYPFFFTLHSLSFMEDEKEDASRVMERTQNHIKESIKAALESDEKIQEGAFTENLTTDDFASVIFAVILSDMTQGRYNPRSVIEIIRRTLY